MKRHLLLLLVLIPATAIAGRWPAIEHPRGARIEGLGEQVRLNGVPMRMTRTLAVAPVDAIVAHYRRALGTPVAHARVADTQVLAQARGDFFITVTVSPLPDGASEALLAIADMPAAHAAAGRLPGIALPAGSELLSDMESIDGRIGSRQWVVTNPHGLHTNLKHFSARLADRGLEPDGPPQAAAGEALTQGFRGPSGEARLVLVRRDGTTSAVLTLLSRHP